MKIGILGPAEIARRRFAPALAGSGAFELAGVASYQVSERFGELASGDPEAEAAAKRSAEKACTMAGEFGGRAYRSFRSMLSDEEVDSVYVPLPPAYHERWVIAALQAGKHVLVEKPAAPSLDSVLRMVKAAADGGLALHENYAYRYHAQMAVVRSMLQDGIVGDVREVRVRFGFPRRSSGDFRYEKSAGGGSLLDAGGYTLDCVSRFLGGDCRVVAARLSMPDGFGVDLYGSGMLVNERGAVAHVSFGMDNQYKCELEVWGSAGCLTVQRILTAPADFKPVALLEAGSASTEIALPVDDSFARSIDEFALRTEDDSRRLVGYEEALAQARLIEAFAAEASGLGSR